MPAQVMAHLRAANAQALARTHLLGEMVSPHLGHLLARSISSCSGHRLGPYRLPRAAPTPIRRHRSASEMRRTAAAGRVLEERGFEGWECGEDHGPQFSLSIPHAGIVYMELHPALGRR